MQINNQLLNLDAWSDGQMKSKLWICHELEPIWQQKQRTLKPRGATIWVYGAWYGTLAQIILLRERISVQKFVLFDIDLAALEIAKKMTTMWWLNDKVQFEFRHEDCGEIDTKTIVQEKPDLIINTSCEHFQNYNWYQNLPKNQMILIQSTNMLHPTHILNTESLDNFKFQLGQLSKINFEGELNFKYPNFSFTRYMIIGEK